METRKTIDGYAEFARTLAPLLSEQVRAGAGVECDFAPAPAPPTPAKASEENQLAIGLRFEGALAGQCFFVCTEVHAALLAGTAEEASSLLKNAVQGICEPFAAALFAHYGSVRVHFMDDALPPEDAEAVAWLRSPAGNDTEAATEILIALHADGELRRGLVRLARVAAAAEAAGVKSGNLGLVMDVELNVTLRFGQRQLSLREVMDLTSGSVVELDREVDEPVDLILDGRVIARGEAVIVDGNYGVRVTEVLQPMVF